MPQQVFTTKLKPDSIVAAHGCWDWLGDGGPLPARIQLPSVCNRLRVYWHHWANIGSGVLITSNIRQECLCEFKVQGATVFKAQLAQHQSDSSDEGQIFLIGGDWSGTGRATKNNAPDDVGTHDYGFALNSGSVSIITPSSAVGVQMQAPNSVICKGRVVAGSVSLRYSCLLQPWLMDIECDEVIVTPKQILPKAATSLMVMVGAMLIIGEAV